MNSVPMTRTEQQGPPLCCSYLWVLFGAITSRAVAKPGLRLEQRYWAVGTLPDGSTDFLGLWRSRDSEDFRWSLVVNDLRERGVVRLRHVLGPDPAEMQAAFGALYGDVRALPAVGVSLSGDVIDSIPSGHWRRLLRAQEVAIQLGQRLRRAAAAHGAFSSSEAAQAFIGRTAERYLDGLPKPGARPIRAPLGRGLAATAVVR
jgi:hypothetical protein